MPVAWTDTAAVLRALGDQSGAAGDAYLTDCVDAANATAFRKRQEAGYTDQPVDGSAAPSADVALGTTMLAVDLYRARGADDRFAGFDELAALAATSGNWPQIRRLLGVGRAAVDRADPTVTPLRYRRTVGR